MDRLSQLRGEAGGSRDSTLDTTSPPSEAFMTANESSSKFYSLSEVDSTFDITSIKDDISSIKDVSLASTTTESDGTMTNADELISNLSPIRKKSDILDSYKIDTQIEAANILSGGVAIFDDNENSYDGHELVIDDNVEVDEKSNSELKQSESLQYKPDGNVIESSLISEEADIASKDTEVVLQIDGKNVDAIDIGNGLYLYRKEGQEELAAVQIVNDDDQQTSFKFLKVRENAEGNLEVYEEIEIEVPKEVPVKEGKMADKITPSHVPIKDINKVISESTCTKVAETKVKTPRKETIPPIQEVTDSKETSPDTKEVNLNGKMMKFSESRKSPVIGSFTPMTFHSTPNKEGIPLTKTMVDQQLHPNRHLDLSNVKKTIEVHTDSCKQKSIDTPTKNKDADDNKSSEITSTEKDIVNVKESQEENVTEEAGTDIVIVKVTSDIVADATQSETYKIVKIADDKPIFTSISESIKEVPMEQDNEIDSTEKLIEEMGIEINNDDCKMEESNVVTKEKDEEKMEIEQIEEKKIDAKDNVEKIKEVIQVHSEVDKGKEQPMETELTVVEASSLVKEYQKIAENNSQNKDQETKIIEIVKDKQEMNKIDIDKPIVIRDDVVSITEKVNDKCQKNVSDNNSKDKSDDKLNKIAKVLENILNDVEVIEDNKNVEFKESAADSTSCSVQAVKNPSNTAEQHKNEKIDTISTKTQKESVDTATLRVPAEITEVKSSVSTDEIDNKHFEPKKSKEVKSGQEAKPSMESDAEHNQTVQPLKVSVDQEKQTLQLTVVPVVKEKQTAQPPVTVEDNIIQVEEKQKQAAQSFTLPTDKQNRIMQPKIFDTKLKQTQPNKPSESKLKRPTLPLKVSDDTQKQTVSKDKQNNKVVESLTIKDAARKETIKHIAGDNISPLMEQKQQSLVASKAALTKSVAPEKNVIKTSPGAQNVNTTTNPKVESKTAETLQRKEPMKSAVVEQKRTDSNTPAIASQPIKISKPVAEVHNTEIQKNIQKPGKNVIEKHLPASDAKNPSYSDEKKDTKLPTKDIASEKGKNVINIVISKVPKLDPAKVNVVNKQDVSSTSSKVTCQSVKNNIEIKDKQEMPRASEPKPINNNHSAVPFGKWTEANRQEFLNKFKTKASVTSSSSNQLKNSNDLNRRDVLKKIDSQRSNNALTKTQEANKLSIKPETAAFSNKPNIITKEVIPESKIPQKTETVEVKTKTVAPKNIPKPDVVSKSQNESSLKAAETGNIPSKKEVCQRTGVVQNLIDKTIEGMIHRSVLAPKVQDEPKQSTAKEASAPTTKTQQTYQPIEQATLDAIEMKMNELHGIPFIERPPHELPQVPKADPKTYSKNEKKGKEEENSSAPIKSKVPNLLPFPNKTQQKVVKESVIEVDSEDEVIEHEPITGDIDLNKKNQVVKPPDKEKLPPAKEKLPSTKEKLPPNTAPQIQQEKVTDTAKKEPIITEKDFDKFARRNSITYENCITVNFEGKEPHNVIQTVVEKDPSPKSYSRNDSGRIDPKAKLPLKYQNVHSNPQPTKLQPANKFGPVNDDASNRNQSKLQKAYQSALTAKRQMTTDPITIIEDKPVKVVFMDSVQYVPSQLNVQGQGLSPTKKVIPECDITASTCDSLDSDMMDSREDTKSPDEVKTKTKHQRKQVLTPVDEPELELIEPKDLGLEVSSKKKRKTEDDKTDKNMKYPMRKKIYLLGSNAITEEKSTNPVEVLKNPLKETVNLNDNGVAQKNPVSALDSLVKAAELIETQTENITQSIVSSNSDSNPNTPVKRGRGRPRKYPLTPDGTVDKSKVLSAPSPQKKPRLIDAKVPKRDVFTDDSDSDDEIIKENWTMGKINENIVCPICNKLFRTENVVFKHVKHCTGPSPSRSDSDKRSPRRMRSSQDFDTKSRDSKSDDMDIDDDKPLVIRKETPKKRKSKDSVTKPDDKDDIIVIEDTPIKDTSEKVDEQKHHESRKSRTKIPHKSDNLVCEFCGKTFRQLSYLVSHKLQHKKEEKEKVEPKKTEKEAPVSNKSVYSCEVCKKEFRKLHHLVQHRIIHNPNSAPAKSSRKSSTEQFESKVDKEPSTAKQSDDPSAGFRCEPCDKSFRKLHHLVEHRETHDGINRQKTTTAPITKEDKVVEKPVALYPCDICKKTFKKLQQLNEHREQHVETSSDKSDDKSVKSSLSTRDIIHECSLCYMVFPNEHSLNKHTIFCQRKKRQSKQVKPTDETEEGDVIESPPPEEKMDSIESSIIILEDSKVEDEENQEDINKLDAKAIPLIKGIEVTKEKSTEDVNNAPKEKDLQKLETKNVEQVPPTKRDFEKIETTKTEAAPVVPEKIKKVEEKVPKLQETPKKKTPLKEKTGSKRLKTTGALQPVIEDVKPAVETSDDDEVRYMLNPNFKAEEVTEEKVFMKVRAKKRSSLQIERPNSKDLMKRRTSLQHPPKIPRLKPKAVEATTVKKEVRIPKVEPVPSTDSDDSETTKYSFPSTIPEKPTKPAQDRTPKNSERKILKKTLADKRKSLSGIAKRKSVGKAVTARHKVSPLKQIKKRTLDVEHRCDCGQLFSSAALLSRHTTLAHTPPRIRRRRSPPPEEKPTIKPAARKSTAEKPKQTPAARKSSARSDSSTSTNTKATKSEVKGRKSIVKDAESPKIKTEKSEAKSSVKPRRTGAHRGVPVPDKMRKLMQKNK